MKYMLFYVWLKITSYKIRKENLMIKTKVIKSFMVKNWNFLGIVSAVLCHGLVKLPGHVAQLGREEIFCQPTHYIGFVCWILTNIIKKPRLLCSHSVYRFHKESQSVKLNILHIWQRVGEKFTKIMVADQVYLCTNNEQKCVA